MTRFFLRLLAIGDIHRHSQQSAGISLIIRDASSSASQPADGAVRQYDPILHFIIAPGINRVANCRFAFRPVFRMNPLDEIRVGNLPVRIELEKLAYLVRNPNVSSIGIEFPYTNLRRVGSESGPLLK